MSPTFSNGTLSTLRRIRETILTVMAAVGLVGLVLGGVRAWARDPVVKRMDTVEREAEVRDTMLLRAICQIARGQELMAVLLVEPRGSLEYADALRSLKGSRRTLPEITLTK